LFGEIDSLLERLVVFAGVLLCLGRFHRRQGLVGLAEPDPIAPVGAVSLVLSGQLS
jgi:hypothetical protein